jgi:mannitol/fructose-specific phosphotransferase system IIA component (Ntr-type)
MTTINDTVATALRNTNLAGYVQQAQPVVNALVEREQVIYTGLVEAGVALGASNAKLTSLTNFAQANGYRG